jgi:hypothetical protein
MQLSGALPKGDNDGITSMESRLIKKPKGHIVALVILDAKKVETDVETGEKTAKLKIRRIESILPEDVETAAQLIRRSFESRTGETTLPIDLENDLKSALAGASLYEPSDEPAVSDSETSDAEEVIDVPEGGYGALTVPLLTALLRKRGLDATQGKKAELIDRLEAHDADPNASLPKTNVTNLFADGSTPDLEKNSGDAWPQEAPSDLIPAEQIDEDEDAYHDPSFDEPEEEPFMSDTPEYARDPEENDA